MTRIVSAGHLGRGWGLPLVPPEEGRGLPWAAGSDKVRQSLYIILDTEPGERVMRPDFGCPLKRHLMEPNTAANRALVQREVQQAIRQWEPRVELEKVTVTPGDDPAMILIHIQYVHKRDGSPGNLVYPFYLEGA